MLHHMGVLRELDNFMNMVLMLKVVSRPAADLRDALAKRIVKVYLRRGPPRSCHLSEHTAQRLREGLLSQADGVLLAWLPPAEKELCPVGLMSVHAPLLVYT